MGEYSYVYSDNMELGIVLAVYGWLIGLAFFCHFLRGLVNMTLFRKAGYNPWFALIPFFNIYIYHRITFEEKLWPAVFLLMVPGLDIVYGVYLYFNYAKAFGASNIKAVLYVFFPLLTGLFGLVIPDAQYVGKQQHIFSK